MAEPKRVPLYSPIGERYGTNVLAFKDSRLINGFAEKDPDSDEIWAYKRPGLSLSNTATAGLGAGLGVFNWLGNIYSVVGGHLYKDGVDKGAVDTTGIYSFSACLGAVPKLFLKNTAKAYTYDDAGGLVLVVDADYPATTVPGAVYIDGTMYVFSTPATIRGSDLNAPASWDPLNTVIAQIEPDQAIAIAKHLTYLIAFKGVSAEVFYDAGNATGSPLAPVQGSKIGTGCKKAGSVCRIGDELAWVGTGTEGSLQVMVMSKVHAEPISTPPVERMLASLDFTTVWSWTAKIAGHRFYVLTLPGSNLTFAFDLSAAAWYIWTSSTGGYMPIISSTYDSNGNSVLQHATNGNLYTLTMNVTQDDGANFPFSLYTATFDGGLRIAKTNSTTEVVADQVAATVNVSWSDDDYTTYSTPVAVDLSQDRPKFEDGSSFYRRSYLVTMTSAAQLRLKALELMLSAGGF